MEDSTTNLLKVVPPVRSYGLLPPHVPDVEHIPFVRQRLDVEPQCWLDIVDVIPVKFFHYRRLARIVQAAG